MIVADTSALISLASCDTLDLFFDEFDVATTKTVVEELEELAEHEDRAAENAGEALGQTRRFTIHDIEAQRFQSSRIDEGEGSCVKLSYKTEAKFLITDDLRALPELQTLTETRVAISPIVLKSLVQRASLEREEALQRLEEAAEKRDWLGAPIYRQARKLFSRPDETY